jgi:hypothetical protein
MLPFIKTLSGHYFGLFALAEVAGVDVSQLKLDGQSMLPYLLNTSSSADGRTLFHHCNKDIFAIR